MGHSLRSVVVVLTAVLTIPAATISTTADCAISGFGGIGGTHTGGGVGIPNAYCLAVGFDRGHSTYNSASANVTIAPDSVSVAAEHNVYRFAPLDASATADFSGAFEVTFTGAPGFGLFVPCFTIFNSGSGKTPLAQVALLTAPVTIPSLGPGPSASTFIGSTCVSPGTNWVDFAQALPFAFGDPIQFTVDLHAASSSLALGAAPRGRSSVTFNFQFLVRQPVSDPNGNGHVLFLLPVDAAWTISSLSVPEPSTFLPVALVLAAGALMRIRSSGP